MASDSLRRVTGILKTPTGAAFNDREMTWVRYKREVQAQGDTLVVDMPFTAQTDATGAIDLEVMPGSYVVSVLVATGAAGRSKFTVTIPDAPGPFNIADMVATGPVSQTLVDRVVGLVSDARSVAEAFGDVDAAIAGASLARDAAADWAALSEERATRAASERDGAETARDLAAISARNAQGTARLFARWDDGAGGGALGAVGTLDGEGIEVLDSDTGTHGAATAGGYDGPPVANAGRYAWDAGLGRWVRLGGTGLSAKLDRSAADTFAMRSVIDGAAGPVFAYGQEAAAAILDAELRPALFVTRSGELLGKLGIAPGGQVTAEFDPLTGRMTLALAEHVDPLPLPGSGRMESAGGDLFMDGVKVLQAVTDEAGRIALAVREDGSVFLHGADRGNGLSDEIALIGDSLTAASANGPAWEAATGLPVRNRGIGGQQSDQIAARYGAVPVGVTIAGGQIDAGANTITHLDGAPIDTTDGAWRAQLLSTPATGRTMTLRGQVAGVAGVMTRETADGAGSAEAYTFTPDGDQVVPVRCPAGTVFLPEENGDCLRINIIGMGRNNYTDPIEHILAGISGVIDRMRERGNDRFVILTVPNGAYGVEAAGGSGYQRIEALNQAMMRTWPRNVFDARRWLIDKGLAALGIAPTAQDLADIADDIVPASLRRPGDNLHYSDAAYSVLVPEILKTMITPKGWLK